MKKAAVGPSADLLDNRQGQRSRKSFLESHQAPGYGESYDACYASDPDRRYWWTEERRVLDCVMREFYGGQTVRLLDFACGTGRISSFLESYVDSSVGVDVSDSMLEVARKKLLRTQCMKVNLVKEPVFPKGSFNLITAFRFFLNAEQDLRAAALRALEPLLTDDGCFVFNVHRNAHSLYYAPAILSWRIRRQEVIRTLSVGECERLLREVGLKIARVYPVGLLHIPKLDFNRRIRAWADRAATRSSLLGRVSDSPIIVARKSK